MDPSLVDHQAEQETEDHQFYDSSEEDEDDEALPEDEAFVVDGDDDDEEGDGSDDDEHASRKKKKKKRKEKKRKKHRHGGDFEDLDEDDLELLAETTGVRPPRPSKKNHFKRLKRRKMSIDASESGPSDDDLPDRQKAVGISGRQQDLSHIFDDPTADQRYDDDDVDNFIVHDETDRQEGYPPRRRPPAGGEYFSPDQWQDMHDIFGTGNEYDWAMKQQGDTGQDPDEPETPTGKTPVKAPLSAVFEPAELASQMMTEKDDVIRQTDIPERMQLAGITSPVSEEEEREEALFIAKLVGARRNLNPQEISDGHELYEPVAAVVHFLRVDMLEVPFIHAHRQDYWYHPENPRKNLSEDDLWYIYDADETYRAFRRKKMKLLTRYSKLGVEDDYFLKLIRDATTIELVEDLSEYLVFEHAERILEVLGNEQSKGPRGATRIETYKIYRNPELQPLVKAFGVSPRALAEQLIHSKRVFDDDVAEDPEPFATKFLDRTPFKNPASLIRGVKSYLCDALAKEPEIRRYVRGKYESVVVTVSPTESGKRVITNSHPYHKFKYLRCKPADKFTDGQFLQIVKGEEDGLLNVKVHLKEEIAFIQQMSTIYLSDGYSHYADAWNTHRVEILNQVITSLLPIMEASAKERLKKQAMQAIGAEFRKTFHSMINVAPLPAKISFFETARVMVISLQQGPNRTAQVHCVLVNELGRFVKELVDDQQLTRLTDFLNTTDQLPDVLLLAGNPNLQLRKLWEQLKSMKDLVKNPIPQCIIEDEVGRLYQYSRRAKKEFPTASPIIRYSMALARLVQNPAMEYAAMFDQDNTITMLNVHPLQHMIPTDQLMKFFERSMVDLANIVGIDINDAVNLRHRSGILQFVAGLGPRKAAAILTKISRLPSGLLLNRDDLVQKNLVGERVYRNCASAIRIRKKYEEKANVLIDILDDTRINPEDYQIARKMAADALDVDHEDEAEYPSQYVQTVIDEVSDKLEDLVLDDYADYILTQIQQSKRRTLDTIKNEMKGPYKERRVEPKETDDTTLFKIVTGESEKTLAIGKNVYAEVVKVLPKLVICRLDSGLDATIHISEISQDRIEEASQVVSEGEHVKCKIIRVDATQFKVALSMKQASSEDDDQGGNQFGDGGNQLDEHGQPQASMMANGEDEYYDKLEEQKDREKAKTTQPAVKRRAAMKSISHPLFKRMGQLAAEKYLSDRGRGEAVIRPSTRGPDCLTVSWKAYEGVFCHIDLQVNERENEFDVLPPTDKKNVAKDEYPTYHELDEMIVQHIEASARHIDELTAHRKFRDLSEEGLEVELTQQKRVEPKHIAYGICIAPQFPTYFIIMYKRGLNTPCSRAYMKVVPKGFKLKMLGPNHNPEKIYNTVEELLNDFKKKMAESDKLAQQRQQYRPPPPVAPSGGFNAGGEGWGHPAPPPRPMPGYNAYGQPSAPPAVPAGGGGWGGGNDWNAAPGAGSSSAWGGSPPNGVPASSTAAAGGWGGGGWD